MSHTQQLLLNLPKNPNYTAASFITHPSNWEAIEWIQRWPDWPMKMMAIYGDKGCGKTHLAHIWQEKSKAHCLQPSDISRLSPLEALNNYSAVILDDADTITQEDWLFHFYNLVKEKGAYLLLCCEVPPTQWKVALPDLKSRLATIFSIEVTPPDEEALKSVLFKLCSEAGMSLAPEIADYILRRVERSFECLRDVVDALDHYTLSTHRQLTMGVVREVLKGSDDL